MLEEVTKNTARNISNGILLQVCDLQKGNKQESKYKKDFFCKTKKQEDKIGKNEYKPSAFTLFAAELIGTGLLMFLGCMGCVIEVDNPPAPHQMNSLAFGLVILLIIQAFGHISGAHLNPAVTLAAVLMKVFSPLIGLVYITAQFVGGLLGFGLLKVLLPSAYVKDGFCMTLPHSLLTPIQALVIETIITATLIVVVCAVWDARNADKPDSVPMRFAFIVVAISMVAGPFTGASMNTVRTFAPALFLGNLNYQWIYWIGPNIGAILGCGIYKFLFAVPEKEEIPKEESVVLEDVKPEKS
ncbi:aquaporin AQPAe.a isoform X2 [Leptinotarsa decemlineata]